MKNLKVLLMAVCCGVVLTALVGCNSLFGKAEKPEKVKLNYPARITMPARPAPMIGLTNREDPNQYVGLAVALADKGRYKDAAGVFLNAAQRFSTENQRFEQDCTKAAIKCYWLDGDLDKCRDAFETLKTYQTDDIDSYGLSDNLRRIKGILASDSAMKH